MSTPGRTRVWRPAWPCPVGSMLDQQRHGGGDPTHRVDAHGRHWRGTRTPEGPATLAVEARPAAGEVHLEAWGPGAEWALEQAPDLLGAERQLGRLRAAGTRCSPRSWRHHPHARLGRSGLVMESLVPAIIEQKVTGQEAFAGFRMLVHRFGERAPGPGRDQRLWVQPAAGDAADDPLLGVAADAHRPRAVPRRGHRRPGPRHRSSGWPPGRPEEFDAGCARIPGIGVWTSAEVRQRSLGDPDAVSFGDYHVAKDVGWALTGEPFDDERLAEFLEPWRPQRGRVPALVAMAGLGRPRRGPRMAPRTHLPAKVRRP